LLLGGSVPSIDEVIVMQELTMMEVDSVSGGVSVTQTIENAYRTLRDYISQM
jgi:hypothetical protein